MLQSEVRSFALLPSICESIKVIQVELLIMLNEIGTINIEN